MIDNKKIKILVVGGAGFIGSHMVKMLLDNNYNVTTFDNLSTGYRDAVIGGEFIEGDLADNQKLSEVFKDYSFNCVMHFASSIEVGESIHNPKKYYKNNLINTINLLNQLVKSDTQHIIFSSTAAIYGNPNHLPIDEDHTKNPINPYGKTKLMIENVLTDYSTAYNLKFVSLRYFNAAGCDPSGLIGERHNPETHLIPLVLKAASGRNNDIKIFGNDYDTKDGTCVRDYIHVNDICDAHIKSMEYLIQGGISQCMNLGNGSGFTVNEIIDTTKKITKKDFDVINMERRSGDPSTLVADSSLARKLLNWEPVYSDLDKIISHAWNFERKYFLKDK